MESSFLLICFFFFFELNRTRKNSSSWQPSYFCVGKMFMLQFILSYRVLNSIAFQGSTSNFTTLHSTLFSISKNQFILAKCCTTRKGVSLRGTSFIFATVRQGDKSSRPKSRVPKAATWPTLQTCEYGRRAPQITRAPREEYKTEYGTWTA